MALNAWKGNLLCLRLKASGGFWLAVVLGRLKREFDHNRCFRKSQLRQRRQREQLYVASSILGAALLTLLLFIAAWA